MVRDGVSPVISISVSMPFNTLSLEMIYAVGSWLAEETFLIGYQFTLTVSRKSITQQSFDCQGQLYLSH